jgi:tetratricopeptide (TPR) repeat protein
LLFEQGAITVDDYLGQARANLPRRAPNPALAQAFHQNIARAIARSEQQLRERPADPEAHFQVGSAYGFQASYTATVEGRVMGSLGMARRAYREHVRVLELDPQRKDAGLIVGMYRYSVANLSAPMRLLARLAGIGGDREAGIRLVEEAARYTSAVQANALFTLILIYNREARYDEALAVIAQLRQLYPGNRLLWLEAGSTALRAGRAADARVFLEEGLVRLSGDSRSHATGEDSRWHYAYGSALVALHEAAPAERALTDALTGAERAWVRGRIHKELGKLADLRGDRSRALTEYRTAARLCQEDHDTDCDKELTTLTRSRSR